MKRILFVIVAVLLSAGVYAQPKKSRVQQNRAKATAQQNVSRASLMFPTAVAVPENVPWRRDVYRTIDLTQDANAPLYYPVEPRQGQVNLFTLLFQLLNVGKIPAYNYDINSSMENFEQSNRMHFKDMLDRYNVPYVIDGKSINVEPVDVPSSEVLSYYVKESSYYDEGTATYHTRVVALCPVLHRSDEWTMDNSKYPLFWVKFDDIEPYLSQHMIMASNMNNAAQISMADFFQTNRYKGDIYMTTNLQGKPLQELYRSDSLRIRQQKKIEQELTDFEKHIWATPVDSAELARKDSIEAAALEAKNKKRTLARSKTQRTTASRSSRRSSSSDQKDKKEKTQSAAPKAASQPRVSVRRQRH